MTFCHIKDAIDYKNMKKIKHRRERDLTTELPAPVETFVNMAALIVCVLFLRTSSTVLFSSAYLVFQIKYYLFACGNKNLPIYRNNPTK